MERCAHCGTYFPKRDAVHRGGKSYCSADARCRQIVSEDTFITQEGRLKGVPSSPFYSSSFHPSPYWDERPQLTKSGAAGDPVDLIVLHYISLPAGTFGGDAVDRLFMGTLDPDRRDWPQDPAWELERTQGAARFSPFLYFAAPVR